MSKKDNHLESIINKLSLKFGLPKEVIREIVESPYSFIRETIKEIDLDQIQEAEDLDKVKSTFNLMGLGKLHINMKKLKAIRKNINNKKDEI